MGDACEDSDDIVIDAPASHKRGAHALRDLFRTSSDSESSDDGDDQADGCVDEKQTLAQNVDATGREDGSVQAEITVVRTVQHVKLEVCTVGGSIEHRLWPAAEFLVSYILQQDNADFSHESMNFPKRWSGRNSAIYSDILRDVQAILQRFSSGQTCEGLKVIELGAGVGFTSLELAHHVSKDANVIKNNIRFLLTDLPSAIPLLQRNIHRNFEDLAAGNNYDNGNCPIQVQKLEWGNLDDIQKAICWYQDASLNGDSFTNALSMDPLLILGSDCVYWESLYGILETTIAALLQNAPPRSICLLANVRRWKRDTHFFQNILGQSSATSIGRLHCVCIHELVSRTNGNENGDDDFHDTDERNDVEGRRQVLRIYAVQWVPTL